MYHHKTILITGASSGLGRNMALNYAKQGGTIINISRSVPKMTSLQSQLEKLNTQPHLYYYAVGSDYLKIQTIRQVLQAQPILPDVIVHNAAGNFLAPFQTLSENGWKRIIDIVLHGAFNVYHVFGKEMISQRKSACFFMSPPRMRPRDPRLSFRRRWQSRE